MMLLGPVGDIVEMLDPSIESFLGIKKCETFREESARFFFRVQRKSAKKIENTNIIKIIQNAKEWANAIQVHHALFPLNVDFDPWAGGAKPTMNIAIEDEEAKKSRNSRVQI